MNAEYPANPAAPGAHPFPGVTQAAPQGPGGPEAAPPALNASFPQSHAPQAPGGGHQRPAPPSVPPAHLPTGPYANPGTATAPARSAPAPGGVTAPQPTTGQPSTQHSTQHPAANPSQPGPVRRASLRTGTQEVRTSDAEETDGRRKMPFFGKKNDNAEEPKSTEALRKKGGPRKVRAMLSAVDPWSVMKMSFLVAVASGIALVVAVSVVWGVLDTMGAFAAIRKQITDLFGPESKLTLLQYLEYNKFISGATLVASFNVLIITALGTIGALIYNVIAKLVGGVYVTLSDD